MLEDSKEANNPALEPLNQVQAVQPGVNRNQKLFLAILLFIGFSMIVLWAMQLRQGISRPFQPKNSQQPTDNQEGDAQKIDTDKDGLSDYEELNTYATSPYLDDTDGDGILDGAEIKNSTDPNCPEGKKCGAAATQDSGTNTTSTAIVANNISTTLASSSIPTPSPSSVAPSGLSDQEMKDMLEGKMDANTLRKALLNSGADPKLLGQLSDEDLVKSYQKSLSSQ